MPPKVQNTSSPHWKSKVESTSNARSYTVAKTHPGMKRKNNEDRFSISAYHLSKDDYTPSTFAIIADGVGGNMAGEVAAQIAVNTITNMIANSDAKKPEIILENAIVQASIEIYNQSTANPAQTNMGSTCVCAWVISDRLYIANVGDSRIYLIRDSEIHQLTIDHSWIQEAIERGILSLSQAIGHPRAHVINRYLGTEQRAVPDFRLRLKQTQSDEQMIANQGFKLKPKDIILLCTDGLTDVVKDEEIFFIITKREREQAIDDLIALANKRGGPDNITIALLEMPETSAQEIKQKSNKKKKRWMFVSISCLVTIIVFVLIISISASVLWYKSQQQTPTTTLSIEMVPPISTPNLNKDNPTQGNQTPEILTPLVTQEPSSTPISATYTPWSTSTRGETTTGNISP